MSAIVTTKLAKMPLRVYSIECPRLPGNTALLAGGLDVLGGPRGNSFAYLGLYDLNANRPVWEFKETKNHPFEKVVATDKGCAALMSLNFTRAVQGVFLFDLSTGEEIARVQEGSIIDIGVLGDQFIAATYPNCLAVINAAGEIAHRKELPYAEETPKRIKSVFGIDDSDFLAAFSDVKVSGSNNGEMQYNLERWALGGEAPVWEEVCCSDRVRRMNQHFLCWDDRPRTKKTIDIFSETGRVRPAFVVSKGEAKAFVPLGDEEVVVISPKGTVLADCKSGKSTKLLGDAAGDYGTWSVAAARPGLRELVVGHVSHFNNPETTLQRWHL